MSNRTFTLLLVLFVLLFIGSQSVFTINQYEQGLTKKFGKIERKADGSPSLYGPGIHFRIPFIEKVVLMDGRIQTLDGAAERVSTNKKIDLMVDAFVKWRITDFSKFYLRTQGEIFKANQLLERIMNNALRAEYGRNSVIDAIYEKRDVMMQNIKDTANESAPEIGVTIVDVRIKQSNYPTDVSESVFKQMRAERAQAATKYRSEGQKQATFIRADTDKQVTILTSQGELTARRLRADADAKIAKIYSDAFNKDPEFYDFLRSLEAYRNSFSKGHDTMVLSPDNDFFRYFSKEK